ncbi:hypothetical protein [Pseudoalteromonas umbrosa]|uniref:hypothetical protein n=1 Tax=Pseudoalteromonas umbrosa TaxID=3048489 RepID=UPI0024C39A50|nr:hypothetical protein [Pseudoalteromonas sp. B95]MDK1290096.1 hypothetical protein [Pseudoalteromonas sp. B95]
MKSEYTISSITESDLENASAIFEDLISQHAPMAHYLFGWVDARNCTTKSITSLVHDIELVDGTVVHSVYPSAHAWVALNEDNTRYAFEQVAKLRISPKQVLMDVPWQVTGC